MIVDAVPSVEMVRLVNSGTEATMSALRVARGFTGRSLTLKFEGCYHGHVDSLLVKAGSGIATLGIPDTAGVPKAFADTTIAVPFNDLDAVEAAFRERGADIAAIIVEPVAGNMGCVAPKPGFLQGLRQITEKYGAILIFDEVMTGFRLSYGGAQSLYNVTPDMSTLGKIIGGGLPLAAYGGRADIMKKVAPVGPIYQARNALGKSSRGNCRHRHASLSRCPSRSVRLTRPEHRGTHCKPAPGRLRQSSRLHVHDFHAIGTGHRFRIREKIGYRALQPSFPFPARPWRLLSTIAVRGCLYVHGSHRETGCGNGKPLPPVLRARPSVIMISLIADAR